MTRSILYVCLLCILVITGSCSSDNESIYYTPTDSKTNLGTFTSSETSDAIEMFIEQLDDKNPYTPQSYYASVDGQEVVVTTSTENIKGNKVGVQRMSCPWVLKNQTSIFTLEKFNSRGYDFTHESHRYEKSFEPKQNNNVETFVRYYKNNQWTSWMLPNDKYASSENYGKKVAIFGGSFAHNTRAKNTNTITNSEGTFYNGFGFEHEGKLYSLMDYMAEKLSFKKFDNFAVSGEGSYMGTTNSGTQLFPYHTYKQVQNSFKYDQYDIYIIFGGINDFIGNAPLGNKDEGSDANTFYGGLRKAIEHIRTNNPNARIYMTTAFKCFFEGTDWGWNPNSTHKNAKGHTFAEYRNATRTIANLYECPLLDLFNAENPNMELMKELYHSDHVHPNGKGYYSAANTIIDFIAE